MTSTIGASSISAKTKQWPAERLEDLVAQTLSLMRRPGTWRMQRAELIQPARGRGALNFGNTTED